VLSPRQRPEGLSGRFVKEWSPDIIFHHSVRSKWIVTHPMNENGEEIRIRFLHQMNSLANMTIAFQKRSETIE